MRDGETMNATGASFGNNPASLKGKLMSLEVFFLIILII